MRILIATETFYPATDGICTRLAHFVVDFKKRGHEVLVLSPDLGITEYQGVPVKGLDTIKFPFMGPGLGAYPTDRFVRLLKNSIRILSTLSIHSH